MHMHVGEVRESGYERKGGGGGCFSSLRESVGVMGIYFAVGF